MNPTELDESALMECSTDEASAESDDNSTYLDRTTSQTANHTQILAVLQRLENHQSSVRQLQEVSEQPGDQAWTEESLSDSKKKARNLGEDLLEDLLSLECLSGLREDNRKKRKAAIAGIEALLEVVDASKKRLSQAQAQVAVAGSQWAENENREDPYNALGTSRQQVVSGDTVDRLHLERVISTLSNLNLAVDFKSRKTHDGYVISASLPYLLRDRLEINLDREQTALAVNGLCVPSRLEAEQMWRSISEALSRSNPRSLQKLGGGMEAAATALSELGKGKFGSFSQKFRLPRGTDLTRVKASYENGVLEIILPSTSRAQARVPTQFSYDQRFRSGFWGHPAFDW